jgi:hypothetical protein
MQAYSRNGENFVYSSPQNYMEVIRQITHLPPIHRERIFGKFWTEQLLAQTFSGCCSEDKAVNAPTASRIRGVRFVANLLINQQKSSNAYVK